MKVPVLDLQAGGKSLLGSGVTGGLQLGISLRGGEKFRGVLVSTPENASVVSFSPLIFESL